MESNNVTEEPHCVNAYFKRASNDMGGDTKINNDKKNVEKNTYNEKNDGKDKGESSHQDENGDVLQGTKTLERKKLTPWTPPNPGLGFTGVIRELKLRSVSNSNQEDDGKSKSSRNDSSFQSVTEEDDLEKRRTPTPDYQEDDVFVYPDNQHENTTKIFKQRKGSYNLDVRNKSRTLPSNTSSYDSGFDSVSNCPPRSTKRSQHSTCKCFIQI